VIVSCVFPISLPVKLTDQIFFMLFLPYAAILFDIVNTQNFQIQAMYDLLDSYKYPEFDNCDVSVETLAIDGEPIPSSQSGAVRAVVSTRTVVDSGGGGCPFLVLLMTLTSIGILTSWGWSLF